MAMVITFRPVTPDLVPTGQPRQVKSEAFYKKKTASLRAKTEAGARCGSLENGPFSYPNALVNEWLVPCKSAGDGQMNLGRIARIWQAFEEDILLLKTAYDSPLWRMIIHDSTAITGDSCWSKAPDGKHLQDAP
eukprot:Skav234989  [mRNA]  locus=scaffold122:241716:242117:+ [translate_table: standard]